MELKRNFLLMGLLLVLMISVYSSSITRELPATVKPGEKFTVTLDVALTGQDNAYILAEFYPLEFLAQNPSNDGTNPGGEIHWIEFQSATSKKLTYEATAPNTDGTYKFTGTYYTYLTTAGDKATKQTVGGDTQVVVKTPPKVPFCGDAVCNGTETCSSCKLDCGECPPNPTCTESNCLSANECIDALCIDNECVKQIKTNGSSCSTGVCVNGVCKDSVTPPVDSFCIGKQEGICYANNNVEGECIRGEFVKGCTNKVGIFDQPIIIYSVGIIIVIILIVIIISLMTRGKTELDEVVDEKEEKRRKEIDELREQIRRQVKP